MPLKELEDQHWFPHWMRSHQMEFLRFMADRFRLYEPIVPLLKSLLSKNKEHAWYDACSGKGGPVLWLKKQLPDTASVILTDRFPQEIENPPAGVQVQKVPVHLPEELPGTNGLISFFNSFHHFSEKEQVLLLQKAVAANRPVLIAEIVQPTLISGISVLLSTTIGQWLFAPFILPFRWSRLLFTYLLPVHVFTTLYDGLISVAKSNSRKQFEKLAAAATTENYRFRFQQMQGRFARVYVLVGEGPHPLPLSRRARGASP